MNDGCDERAFNPDVASVSVEIVKLSQTCEAEKQARVSLMYQYGFNAQDICISVVIVLKVQGLPQSWRQVE